jgi:hypothetical protein
MNIHRDERLHDYVGRRATAAQAILVCTAFLAFSVALLLSFTRTYLGAAQTSEALLVWTAVFAFVGSLSASGLVWAVTVSELDGGLDGIGHGHDFKPAATFSVDAACPHPASLSLLIDMLDARGGHWARAS